LENQSLPSVVAAKVRLAIMNAKFQIRQRRYQPNLTFDFGGYDYWSLWILAGTALAVLKFGDYGYCPKVLRRV